MSKNDKAKVESVICNPIINMVNTGSSPSLSSCGDILDLSRELVKKIEELEKENESLKTSERNMNDVFNTIVEGSFYEDYDQSSADLGVIRRYMAEYEYMKAQAIGAVVKDDATNRC